MGINFSTFDIARQALNANQFGIAVTGQNIANINTPGYSRQRVMLTEGGPIQYGRFQLGAGVTVAGIQSFRNSFAESRIQVETGIAGRLTAQRDAIYPIQAALQGGENSGLQHALTEFFGAFRDLEANPTSVPLRSITAQKGTNLANTFQSTRARLVDIRSGTDAELRTSTEQINDLSRAIADLNIQVRHAENTGGNSSSFRDQRAVLVNQISDLSGARSTENTDGTITLTIGEGRPLVSGDKVFQLQVKSTSPDGLGLVVLNGEPVVFDAGRVRGLQDVVSLASSQITALDGLAAVVVQKVNSLHTSGTDLNGNAGVNFFSTGSPVTAANIRINDAILADPRLVVASPLTQPSQNGTVAGEIANLLNDQTNVVGSRTGSFSSIFGSFVTEAGEYIRTAENGLQTQGVILAQAIAQRDAVSGVSLDEEAINLIQYQKAFEAAARFLKVADEMTQTILSLAG